MDDLLNSLIVVLVRGGYIVTLGTCLRSPGTFLAELIYRPTDCEESCRLQIIDQKVRIVFWENGDAAREIVKCEVDLTDPSSLPILYNSLNVPPELVGMLFE